MCLVCSVRLVQLHHQQCCRLEVLPRCLATEKAVRRPPWGAQEVAAAWVAVALLADAHASAPVMMSVLQLLSAFCRCLAAGRGLISWDFSSVGSS